MDVFDAFRDSREAVPLSLPEVNQVKVDDTRLRLVDDERQVLAAEEIAERQLDRCERLLWKASPADEHLLRLCKVDLDGLRKQLAAIDPEDFVIVVESGERLAQRIKDLGGGQPAIAIDTNLSAWVLVELERFLLAFFVPLLAEAYAQALLIKVTALFLRDRSRSDHSSPVHALRRRCTEVLRAAQQIDTLAQLDAQMDELDQEMMPHV